MNSIYRYPDGLWPNTLALAATLILYPLGFALLMLQGVSELIKRIAFLTGDGPDTLSHTGPSEAELLAEEIAAQEKARQAGAAS